MSNKSIWVSKLPVTKSICAKTRMNQTKNTLHIWIMKIQVKFSDKRSKRIAQRIIFDNSPETIDEEPYKVLLEFIKSRWLSNDFNSPWITIPNALREIEKFEEQEEQKIFEGYKDYLMEMKENL